MKLIKFLILGILFGVIMTKSEAISWFRIQEMFRFQSFHMYGIIGSALVVGIVLVQLMKRSEMKTDDGSEIKYTIKPFSIYKHIFGGTLFGLGWAMTGACPGPLYTLVGAGYPIFIVVILSAVLGAFVYGQVKNKLPH